MADEPQNTPAQTSPAPQQASQTETKTNGMPKKYMLGAIILVVVIVGALFVYTRPQTVNQNSTTLTTVSNITSQTTTITGGCPCLNKQQIETIFNDSTGYQRNATFNVQPLNATLTAYFLPHSTPQYIINNMTAWNVNYTSALVSVPSGESTDLNVPTLEYVVGVVMQTSYASELYNLSLSGEYPYVPQKGVQNGFAYAYKSASSNVSVRVTGSNVTEFGIIGYKGNYFVDYLFITHKQVVYQNIISALSSTT